MVASTIPVKGAEDAKKKPPKFIERVIDKVEEALTAPASKSTKGTKPKPQQQTPEQADMQGSLGGSREYVLPRGTTITLPDGKAFETQAESILIKKQGI
jgi:hypothetical protein